MITGAILGVLGTALQAVIGWGERKQASNATERELQLQLQIQQAELEVVKAKAQGEAAAATIKTDGEANVARITADATMFKDSQVNDKAAYNDRVIDFLRGSVRPVVTYLCVGSLLYLVTKYMTEELAEQLLPIIVPMLLDLTATVVVWWFGGRFIKRG